MSERRLNLPLALALLGSLLIHALGLSAARQMAERRRPHITGLSATTPDDERDETTDPDEPEEVEIIPGIDDGALSTVTWIGYEEYEEHLAQLAEVEQAAFTRAESRGNPIERSEPVLAPEIRTAISPLMSPSLRQILVPKPEIALELEESGTPVQPMPETPAERLEDIAATPPTPEDAPITPAENADSNDATEESSDEELTEPATPTGEPTAPDAEKTDKDSDPTSTREVPQVEWNSGKPVAVEGLEIHPYSLYRHIVVDSKDIHFAMQWSNTVDRNPIVEISFDRTGRVARLDVLRESGNKALDKQYLRPWLARWTASGKKLADLKSDQSTQPIMIRLIFIKEPKPGPEENESGGH